MVNRTAVLNYRVGRAISQSGRRLLIVVASLLTLLYGGALRADTTTGQYTEIYDFTYDWLVYESGQYVPYTPALHKSVESASLLINLRENQQYQLIVSVSEPHYIFLNGALFRRLSKDQRVVFKVDSLLAKQPSERMLLTLYGGSGHLGKKVWLGYARATTPTSAAEKSDTLGGINIKPLKATDFVQFTLFVFLLLIAYNVLIASVFSFGYTRILSPLNYVNRDERNDLYKNIRPLSGEVVALDLNLALIAAYLLLLWGYTEREPFLLNRYFSISSSQSIYMFMRIYVQLVVGLMGLFMAKYIIMYIVGSVLRLDAKITFHYLKGIQSSTLFFGALLLIGMLGQINQPLWQPTSSSFLVAVLVFYAVRFVSLYVLVNNRTATLNLYLFSYLCIVEVIPLIVGFKMIL